MASGVIITLLALGLAILLHPRVFTPEQGQTAALIHVLKWDVLIVVWLVVNIGLLAQHRFFTAADIDGGGLTQGTPQAQVLQSILQNTLEQTVLGVSTHIIWMAVM